MAKETATDVLGTIQCSLCQTSKAAKQGKKDLKLPKGWKRLDNGQPVCGGCWNARYMLRSVQIPVAECVGKTKDEMWQALRAAWSASTADANLAIQALCKHDIVRTPSMEKLPPMQPLYLYGAVPAAMTGIDPSSHVAVLHAVEQRYRKCRFDLVWTRTVAPPCYRYPQPYPIRENDWKCEKTEHGESLLHCRFQGDWWVLRLRGGPQFKRLTDRFIQLASGQAVRVEMALLRKGNRCMAKLVGWFPRGEKKKRSGGEMAVYTSPDRFLTANLPNRDPWHFNADHVRRWIAEHEIYRQRMADDLKYEKRWPAAKREAMNRAVAKRCDRQHNRLKDFIGVASKMLVAYAARNDVERIELNIVDRNYFPSFPWDQFLTAVKYKADENDIELTVISPADVKTEDPATAETPAETGDA